MPLPPAPKSTVRWVLPKTVSPSPRTRPVSVSLGCHIEGAALPHPCGSDPWSALLGTVKRSASQHPVADPKTLTLFFAFVQEWLDKNLTPLEPESDTSVERWLSHTSYPLWKKESLLAHYLSLTNAFEDPKFLVNSCFIKDETYVDYKYPRGIYSRSDTAKLHIGPFVKLIEEEVYKNPYFIKHVPVSERPTFIMENVHNATCPAYLATDYTAFESQFVKQLMQGTEIVMLKHMTRLLPDHKKFWWLLDNVMAGTNDCSFQGFRMYIEATRMSGEMTTSLSNGFSNLMFMLFTSQQCGLQNVRGVVEGDDGLFSYDCPPNACVPGPSDFAKLGLTIKIEKHEKLSTASFCGMVFDEMERIPLTDPLKAIANLGWMDHRFTYAKQSKLNTLLRCKALSMKAQYPGCPVLDAASTWILRCTRSYDVRHVLKNGIFGTWKTEQMERDIRGNTRFDRMVSGPRTRQLVQDKFALDVGLQLRLEAWFDSQNTITEIPLFIFENSVPSVWINYFDRFACHRATSPLPDVTPARKYASAYDLVSGQSTRRLKVVPDIPSSLRPLFAHESLTPAQCSRALGLRPPQSGTSTPT